MLSLLIALAILLELMLLYHIYQPSVSRSPKTTTLSSYPGEYIEYNSSPIVINQYTMGTIFAETFNSVISNSSLATMNNATSDSILGPDQIVLIASNDRENWVTLNIASNLSEKWIQAGVPHRITVNVANTTPYSYYRWIATRLAYQYFESAPESSTAILCTELFARDSSNQTMVIFPEGLSIPPPVNPETDIAATGIVFIQVADYPFVQDQYYRNYTGTLTSTAVGPSIAPTPTPTPGPLPSYAIYVAIGVGALLLLLVVWFLLRRRKKMKLRRARQLLAEQLKAQEPEPPKPEELQEQLQRLQEQFLQFQQPQQLQSDELPV